MKKTAIVFILIVLLWWGPSMNAFMAGNESDCAFQGNCGDKRESAARGKTTSTGYTLGQLIATGGSAFLHSIADFHDLLGLVESSEVKGLDINAVRNAVTDAVKHMEIAKAAYYQLKSQADVTPYNQTVIFQLIEFDYYGFQKQSDFIPFIFNQVQAYLAVGDVRGVYSRFYNNACDILEQLQKIKEEIDAEIMPDLSDLWKLNQKCSEYKIFAQYVAQVFYKLK